MEKYVRTHDTVLSSSFRHFSINYKGFPVPKERPESQLTLSYSDSFEIKDERVAETGKNGRDHPFLFTFLGRTEIRLGEGRISSSCFDKAAALLTWLSLSGSLRSRSEITSLLWPNLSEQRGRANLSQLLLVLSRKTASGTRIEKERDALRLRFPAEADPERVVDVLQFLSDAPPPGCQRLHAPARCSRCREQIRFRQSLYRGEFLQGESLPNSPPFRLWVEDMRRKLSERKGVLDRLLSGQIESFPPEVSGRVSREWRPLTVLCVLVQGKDRQTAEEILECIEPWRRSSESLLRNRGGEVAKFRKPGLLAYFGYPSAREEDARMAATSALEILASFSSLPEYGTLEIRTVIHSGPAACDLLREIPDATGERTDETVSFVRQAPAGKAVASETAMARLGQHFRSVRRGRGVLPQGGFMSLHVLEPEHSAIPSESLLIGRDRELATLKEAWKHAAEGISGLFWIIGEPGIGKSALVNFFVRSVCMDSEPAKNVRILSCLPEFRETPWFPLRKLFRNTESGRSSPSDAAFLSPRQRPEDCLFLFPDSSLRDRQDLPDLTPEERREKTELFLLDVLLETVQGSPLLLVVEDVHWADYATLSLLRRILDRKPMPPALLLLTCRSGKCPPFLPSPESGNLLELAPLDRHHSRTLVEQTVPGLSPHRMRTILDLGDGIPLYLRELATAPKPTENGHVSFGTSVPAGLQGLMASRIDLLGDLREIAQVSACIGQSVPSDLLMHVGVEGWDERRVLSGIDVLLRQGVLEKDADNPPIFIFHHSLLREALLSSLPAPFLRKTHARIASTLRSHFREWVDREPEFLAGHLARSGACDEAISTWIMASENASARGFPEHAREHLEYALRLVPEISDPSRRQEREQEILTALAQASWFTHGVGSDYVRDLLRQRDAVLETLHVSTKTFPVFYSLWATTNARSGPLESRPLLQLLEKALQLPDLSPADTCQTLFALGEDALWRGELNTAGQFFEDALSRQKASDTPPSFLTIYGEDSVVRCLASLSIVRWQQGFGQTALSLVRQAEEHSLAISNPASYAHSLHFELTLHLFQDEPEQVLKVGRQAVEWAERHGFYQWKILALLAIGWARGNPEGYRNAREVGEALRATLPGLSSVLSLIEADAALRAGMAEEALNGVLQARDDAERKGVRLFYPEFFRLEGEARLRLRSEEKETARNRFLEAIGHASEAGAPMLALKALLSCLRAFPGEPSPAQNVLDTFPRKEPCAKLREALFLSGVQTTLSENPS